MWLPPARSTDLLSDALALVAKAERQLVSVTRAFATSPSAQRAGWNRRIALLPLEVDCQSLAGVERILQLCTGSVQRSPPIHELTFFFLARHVAQPLLGFPQNTIDERAGQLSGLGP